MNHQKNIENVFKAMAPYIAHYLTEPEGRSVYDAVFSVGVRLKSCDIEDEYPSGETDCIVAAESSRQLFYRITKPLNLPYRPRISVSFKLDIVGVGIYCIALQTDMLDENNWKTATDYIFKGSFKQLRDQILSADFAKIYAKQCLIQIKRLNAEIETINKAMLRHEFEEMLDVTDYNAVIAYAESLPKDSSMSIGHGFLSVNIQHGLVLVNTSERTCIPLSDKDGKVLFCTIDDIPQKLLDQIRRAAYHLRDWNLGSTSLSLNPFTKNGIAKLTWVISPYYYCPVDEDGFGEEEEFEVAITCHINNKGQLVDTPVWKEYTGPRR